MVSTCSVCMSSLRLCEMYSAEDSAETIRQSRTGNMDDGYRPPPRTCSSSISKSSPPRTRIFKLQPSCVKPISVFRALRRRQPISKAHPQFSATDSIHHRLAVLGLLGLREVWQFLATTNRFNDARWMDGWLTVGGAPVRGLVADPCNS